jgi:excisionase family DNA binding protein
VDVTVTLAPEQLDLLASRVADLLQERRDDGFFDVDGAAEYLATTSKALYHLVERQKIPHHRAGGRLLFHDMRHAFASRMISRGISSTVLAKLMGHESSAITEKVYVNLFDQIRTDDAVREAMSV